MKQCPYCGKETDSAQLFCDNCGHRLEETVNQPKKEQPGKTDRETEKLKRKKKRWKIAAFLFLLLLAGTGVFCAALFSELQHSRGRVSILITEIQDVETELGKLRDKSDFIDQHVVFVGQDQTYYHTYDCELWKEGIFWAFNIEAAEGKGFIPCEECF